MPPTMLMVPVRTFWRSVMLAEVSRMSLKTRWASCSSASPAAVIWTRAAEPHEQPLVELVLEQEDLAADGGLRHVQPGPGRREGARLRDGADDFQLSEVHGPDCGGMAGIREIKRIDSIYRF